MAREWNAPIVNPCGFPNWIKRPRGQKIFRDYGKIKYGSPLYNDAEYAKKWEK